MEDSTNDPLKILSKGHQGQGLGNNQNPFGEGDLSAPNKLFRLQDNESCHFEDNGTPIADIERDQSNLFIAFQQRLDLQQ